GEVRAANIVAMQVGIELAGLVLVSGALGTGVIGGDLSGELQADSIGTLTIARHLSGKASAASTILGIDVSGDFRGQITADELERRGVGGAWADGLDVKRGVTAMPLASLSGLVFVDFNDDGQVDFGEQGLAGVWLTLAGTDDLGNPVQITQQTDRYGTFLF